MNLYLIERQDRGGYDTFDMAVVAAKDEQEARYTSPNGWQIWLPETGWVRASTMKRDTYSTNDWTSPSNVTATLIGTAKKGTERGVICASFNAG